MNNSMHLTNLKMATAVAAVLTMVASLTPTVAQAQNRFGSAQSNAGRDLSFDLDTSVVDSNTGDDIGEYLGAIQNFALTDFEGTVLSFASGDVTASRIEVPSDFDNYSRLVEGSDDVDDVTPPLSPGLVALRDGGIEYEVTSRDNPGFNLTLIIPSNDSGLINSLEGVNQFTELEGIITGSPGNEYELFGLSSQTSPLPVTEVPEPGATAGLLALGGLGAISLLRGKRRFSRHLSNQDATLSSRAGRSSI